MIGCISVINFLPPPFFIRLLQKSYKEIGFEKNTFGVNLKCFCFNLKAVPWHLYRNETTRFWVHYGLVILGFVLAVVTIIAQWAKPAPYGKHEANVKQF